MIRLLAFLAVVFALGLGFAWLADRPGEMLVTFNGYQYQVTLMVAAVAIVAVVAAVMIVWWLIKSLWNSPYTISRYFRVRRRDRGYQALSTGMIAAGAGDGALARKKTKEAAKLINADQEPLINLLDAQASLLEGDHEGAREKFERMLDDPEMRLLGLRGLYLEAERLGDRNAARHYAGRAAAVAPQLAWAAESTLEELTERGDWDGALKLVEAQKSTRQIERDVANR
ncbi:heme biosynthesis HemY N-terminal domain-containing protein, partial [Mesorhizobium sp.]